MDATLPLWQRLNALSHEMGFDTPKARVLCEAADLLTKRTAQVYTRMTYGVRRVYPANDVAAQFLELTRRDTLLDDDLKVIRTLGFVIEQVHDPRTVIA